MLINIHIKRIFKIHLRKVKNYNVKINGDSIYMLYLCCVFYKNKGMGKYNIEKNILKKH